MMPALNDNVVSLPMRIQSPVNIQRRAHPGAVLLSPKSSSVNSTHEKENMCSINSQLLPSPHHQVSNLNAMLDYQSSVSIFDQPIQNNAAAGPAVVSPLLPSLNSQSYLDPFSRPSSSMATHPLQSNSANRMVSFTNHVNQFCSWVSMLTPSQQNAVMDNLLSILGEEVLQTTKLKLDSLTNSGYISPSLMPIASPVPNREDNSLPFTLDSVLNEGNIYRQWSPVPQSTPVRPIFDYINDISRPKSAEPTRLRQTKFANPKVSTIPQQLLSGKTSTLISHSQHNTASSSSTQQSANSANGSSFNMNPKVLCDPKLLKNIPSWLKSLRLHKYSESLNALPWFELIYLEDSKLEEMGVSALGARRKLLKAFAIVKDFKDRGLIDEMAY